MDMVFTHKQLEVPVVCIISNMATYGLIFDMYSIYWTSFIQTDDNYSKQNLKLKSLLR